MKKLLTIILAISMLATFTACSTKEENTDPVNSGSALETNKPEEAPVVDEQDDETENKETEEKPEETVKPGGEKEEQAKPDEPTAVPEQDPVVSQPQETPADTPSENEPENKPEPEDTTLGNILYEDFKSMASSGMDTLAIAEALLQNPAIQFFGGAMPVEEGLLSGFDNAEITGFNSGAVFMPMIGSIAFIGYVFELPEGGDTSAFIANLRANANLRWNICVSADQMVTGNIGNKVFFVMCPTSLGE